MRRTLHGHSTSASSTSIRGRSGAPISTIGTNFGSTSIPSRMCPGPTYARSPFWIVTRPRASATRPGRPASADRGPESASPEACRCAIGGRGQAPSTKTTTRKPSSLGSKAHPSGPGSVVRRLASCGTSGGSIPSHLVLRVRPGFRGGLTGVTGLEPATSGLTVLRSNQAELHPQGAREERVGGDRLELPTPCL